MKQKIIKEKRFSSIDGDYGLTFWQKYGEGKDKKILKIEPVKTEHIDWIVVYEEDK